MAIDGKDGRFHIFGNLLKTHRTKNKLTLADIGKRCGVTEGYICDLEKSRRIPSYDTIGKLAAALGVPAMLLHHAYAQEVGHYRLPFVDEPEHRKLSAVLLEAWEQLAPEGHCKPLQRQLNGYWKEIAE